MKHIEWHSGSWLHLESITIIYLLDTYLKSPLKILN
jgi:hypothetical protein